MNQPLAASAGNALEVSEAIAFLAGGRRPARLAEVVFALGAEMLSLGGLAASRQGARESLARALDSGQAAERLARMVALQGGPTDLLESPHKYLVKAPLIRDLQAQAGGRIESMDTRAIGLGILALGGGRKHPGEAIDHRVGLSGIVQVGDAVEEGGALVTIHAADEDAWQAAASQIHEAIVIGDKAEALPAVYELIQ
jgi:thymidine phosphorylase